MQTNQLTRTYYFQSELLTLNDFIREQQYVRDLVAAQNSALYKPGVVGAGLTLTMGSTPTTSKQVVVASGCGIDANGRLLFSPAPITWDNGVAGLAAGTYPCYLVYGDSLSSGAQVASLQASHIIVEQPTVSVVKPAPSAPPPPGGGQTLPPPPPSTPPGICLGAIVIGADGGVVSVDVSPSSGRQLAALAITAAPASSGQETPQAQPKIDAMSKAVSAPDAGPAAGGPAQPPLTGPGKVVAAPLTASVDFAEQPDQAAAASFGFQRGATDGGVISLGQTLGAQNYDLINLSFNGARVWAIDQDGAVFTASDASLKDEVAPLQDALGLISRLEGVSFTGPGGRRRVGLVAQQIEGVLPDLVRTEPEGQKMLAYQELIGLLIEAVKELSGKVTALEQQAASGQKRKG